MTDRLQQLHKLLAADPSDADLRYMVALEHVKVGSFAEAVDWLDKALALNAHYHYAYFQKAKALAALGRDEEAKRTLDVGIDNARAAGDAKAVGELSELRASMD